MATGDDPIGNGNAERANTGGSSDPQVAPAANVDAYYTQQQSIAVDQWTSGDWKMHIGNSYTIDVYERAASSHAVAAESTLAGEK